MAIEGVDYAFPPIPSAASLKAAGKQFVCRYGGPGSASKQLTAAERDALHAAGIAIVANAEGAGDGLKGGYAAGVSWAKSADEFFTQLGLPKDRPIYFSVDYDTTAASWPALDAAMDGIASVIGRDRVGVYGEYALMVHLSSNGKAKWFWQTYGWSGGRWFSGNHIEQYKNGVTIGGADCDLNRAMVADYGQWTGDDMALTSQDAKLVAQYVWHDDTQMPAGAGDKRESGGTSVLRARDAAEPTLKAVDALTADMATVKAALARIEEALAGGGSATGDGASPAEVAAIVDKRLDEHEQAEAEALRAAADKLGA